MQSIQRARPYHARLKERALLAADDGRSAFKVYCLEIVGRSEPQRYEWDACGRTVGGFLRELRASCPAGIGFATCFPHITKVFRYSPDAETVLDVRGLWTPTLQPASLERPEGYVEFACLAEALIAADEYRYWAEAATVEEYLSLWSGFGEAVVRRNRKLLLYWDRPAPPAR
jgi:hypothetical protein